MPIESISLKQCELPFESFYFFIFILFLWVNGSKSVFGMLLGFL